MLKLRSFTLPVAAGLLGTALMFAQAPKGESPPAISRPATATRIAVVDVQKILTQSNAGKAAYEKLKKMQDERIAKAKEQEDALKKLEADINTKRPSLSEAKLAEMQKQAAEKRIEMQRYAQDAERQISEARDRELQAIEAKIKPVIDAVAKEGAWGAIFNKFESGLVYVDEANDITGAVIKRFNEASPASTK